jgi:hypothetical protein
MTTAKKRSASPKKSTTKSASVKRAPAKKATARPRSTSVRVSKKPQMQSFKLSPDVRPFVTLTPTVQTLYWTVIGILAIIFTTWLMSLQAQIHNIYDNVDTSTVRDGSMVKPHKQ